MYCEAITASDAITIMSATKIAQPLIHPMCGPNALVDHANVVPQSGSERLRYRYASETNRIGTNEMIRIAGAWMPTPFTATMKPSVVASEYAGAVDAMPITRFDM